MCGIFGVINTKENIDEGRVLAARDVLAHRGPDDAGIYLSSRHPEPARPAGVFVSGSPYVALAHRRLSIIDLSPAAHQPMVSEDGRYVIVFNGEIYNFNEIRNSIFDIRYLKSNSDTEVILKLFDLEGPDCLHKLRGMFAFAIWDDKEKKLFAARDRFGIKPFYYLHNEKEFIFSSELKAIKYYKKGLTLSMEGMDAFLRTGSVPAPLTIYEETKALMPGHWLTIKDEKLEIRNYWTFFDLLNYQPISERSPSDTQSVELSLRSGKSWRSNLNYNDDAKKIIKESLLNTIKAHLVSDVEVGAFLSGGIDSTAIVSLMKQVGHEKIKTVSIVFPDSRFDESKYSRLAAKKYNTEHIEIPFYEKDLLDDFENTMAVMDQPTIDGINTYFVSKAARQAGLKVVLSGLGGDELFGGYPSFNLIPKLWKIKKIPFAKMFMKAAAPLLKNKLPAKAIEYLRNPDVENAEYKLVRGLFTEDELIKLGWQDKSKKNKVKSDKVDENVISKELATEKSFQNPASSIDYLSSLQYVSMMETTHYMRNQLLRDSDVFSMAHSIELRVPFVDHQLYTAVLPYLDDAYDKNFPKKMLVEAVGDIPDEIVHRQKMGFTFPFEDWIMKGQLKDLQNILGIDHSKLNIEKLHWSRLWALFVLNSFTK